MKKCIKMLDTNYTRKEIFLHKDDDFVFSFYISVLVA